MVKRKRSDRDDSDIVERVLKKVKKLVKKRRRIISSSSSSEDSPKEDSAISPAHSHLEGMSDQEFQGKLIVKKYKIFTTTLYYFLMVQCPIIIVLRKD